MYHKKLPHTPLQLSIRAPHPGSTSSFRLNAYQRFQQDQNQACVSSDDERPPFFRDADDQMYQTASGTEDLVDDSEGGAHRNKVCHTLIKVPMVTHDIMLQDSDVESIQRYSSWNSDRIGRSLSDLPKNEADELSILN